MSGQTTFPDDPFWADFFRDNGQLELFGAHSFANTRALPDPDHHAWLAPLHQFGLLKVEGPDATRFLQGQLTADVEALETGATTFAAHCNAKGRMHANFLLHRPSEQAFWLQMHASVIDLAQAALKKYAVFSKVELEDITAQYFIAGFAPLHYIDEQIAQYSDVPLAAKLLWQDRLGSLILRREELPALLAWQASRGIAWQGSARWQEMAIEQGVGFVEASTSAAFIPQQLNMDCLDGISFTKGCYTGQEIIARLKYRGAVSRRCWPFSAELASFEIGHEARTATITELAGAFEAGSELEKEDGSVCGQLVNSVVNSFGATCGLAVFKADGQANPPAIAPFAVNPACKTRIPLALSELPYAIPKH